MPTKSDIYHRARSSAPEVALPAMVKLGWLREVQPTTDSGYRFYDSAGRLFLPAETEYGTNPNLIDSNADGLADGVAVGGSRTGTPVYTCVNGVQRVQYTGVAGDAAGKTLTLQFCPNGIASAPADPWTVSATLRGSVTGCKVSFACWNQAWTDIVSAGDYSVSGTEAVFASTGVAPAGTTALEGPLLSCYNIHEGDVIDLYITKPATRKYSILTPWFSGDTPGCKWGTDGLGTPNASVSVREASALQYPVTGIVGTSGTAAARVVPLYAGNDGAMHRVLGGGTNYFIFRKRSNNKWAFEGTAAVDWIESAAVSFAAGTVHTLAARWVQGVSMDLNHDGTDDTQYTGAFSFVAQDVVNIGGSYGDCSAYVNVCLFSAVPAPQAYVTAVQANSGAAFNDDLQMIALARQYGLCPFLYVPLRGDSRAYLAVT
jgi:hypothetical protein